MTNHQPEPAVCAPLRKLPTLFERETTETVMSDKGENVSVEQLRMRLANARDEVAAIKRRIDEEYRHEAGEQYTPMLRDLRALAGEINVVSEFWESAEKELDDIRDCDKCDLCEDHHD